jgi:hypothetical protein
MIRILLLSTLLGFGSACANAQPEAQCVSDLESRVVKLEGKLRQASGAGAIFFLFGAFCALWAQNTGRSSWLWFFLGLLFSVIAVLVLLSKNAEDFRRRPGKKPFDLQDFRQQ